MKLLAKTVCVSKYWSWWLEKKARHIETENNKECWGISKPFHQNRMAEIAGKGASKGGLKRRPYIPRFDT